MKLISTYKISSKSILRLILVIVIITSIKSESGQNNNSESMLSHRTDDQVKYDPVAMFKNTSSCPPWFIQENTTGQCLCGNELNGALSCDNKEMKIYIIKCYCMTYDNELGITAGSCFINCILRKSNISFQMYLKVPSDVNELNEALCGERWNRTGRLCGECKDEHYPLAYSFDMRCVNCTHANAYNWIKYISSAFLPLTVFFVFVIVSGISATSPQLEAFIISAQIISTPANVRMILEAFGSNKYDPISQVIGRLVITLYGIWNLDFFRALLPNNCLKISTLQVLALDYVIAVYPLVLIILTYIAVDLYDRRLFLLVWVTKPFRKCLKSVDSSMTIKSSILSTFVTFILLSYGKFLTVSFDLLVFTKVYSPDGKAVMTVLFYDASIDYFGHKHLPYGILAIVITFFFNIVPLIFTLIHPLNCFKGQLSKWPALRICLDSFQGCYKDGTEGTCDCRFFSSLYLIIRIALFMLYCFTKNTTFYPIASMLLLCLVSLITLFQPFKVQFKVYNSIHALLIMNISFLCGTIAIISTASLMASYVIAKIVLIISIISSLFPVIYISCLVLKWFYTLRLFQQYCARHCSFIRIHKVMTGTDGIQESDIEESIPHRLENIGEEVPFHTTRNTSRSTHYGSIQQRNI